MQAPNWESYIFPNGSISTCPLDATLGLKQCEQGNVPVIAVDARTPEDVMAAVKFAKTYNLRLVVKNTGWVDTRTFAMIGSWSSSSACRHDYLGRSTARGAFLVWTHYMKNITYNETFKPVGAPSNATMHDSEYSAIMKNNDIDH